MAYEILEKLAKKKKKKGQQGVNYQEKPTVKIVGFESAESMWATGGGGVPWGVEATDVDPLVAAKDPTAEGC